MTLQDLLTMEEVCKMLNVGAGFVYKIMREGKLPYYNLPKRRVSREDLDAYIVSTFKRA